MERLTERDRLRLLVTLGVIGGVLIVLVLVWYRSEPSAPILLESSDDISFAEDLDTQDAAPVAAEIGVDVIGAVQQPGLYYFEPGARVADAIRAAGGYAPNADRDAINEALRLKDEQQVRVPQIIPNAQAPGESAVSIEPTTAGVPAALLDLNAVDAQALEALPGIGPSMASKIVAYREANGPFGSLEQLQDIPGVGPATFSTLRQYLTVTP